MFFTGASTYDRRRGNFRHAEFATAIHAAMIEARAGHDE
jgi:hypothetical protein